MLPRYWWKVGQNVGSEIIEFRYSRRGFSGRARKFPRLGVWRIEQAVFYAEKTRLMKWKTLHEMPAHTPDTEVVAIANAMFSVMGR